MKKEIVYLFLLFLTVLFLVGCDTDVSDDRSKDFDYFEEDISNNTIEYYISFKTHYMNALVKMGSDPYYATFNNDDIINQSIILYKKTIYSINYKMAKEYISYDAEKKLRDFRKILLAQAELEKNVPNIMDSINKAVDTSISILDVNIPIDDDSNIDISSIIHDVASEFNIDDKSAVELIYKPYILYESIIQYHMMYFLKNKYEDVKVEFDGQNEREYELYLKHYYLEYDLYLENIYKEYIERQPRN